MSFSGSPVATGGAGSGVSVASTSTMSGIQVFAALLAGGGGAGGW
jgi:hypothetical protein